MARLVLGRVVAGLLLVLLLTLATYVVFFASRSTRCQFSTRIATGEERAQIREQLGLDDPVLVQWGRFAWRLGTEGDLGDDGPHGSGL